MNLFCFGIILQCLKLKLKFVIWRLTNYKCSLFFLKRVSLVTLKVHPIAGYRHYTKMASFLKDAINCLYNFYIIAVLCYLLFSFWRIIYRIPPFSQFLWIFTILSFKISAAAPY